MYVEQSREILEKFHKPYGKESEGRMARHIITSEENIFSSKSELVKNKKHSGSAVD